MSAWFPMSTARLVRNGRQVELLPDAARWAAVNEEDLATHWIERDGERFFIGAWCKENRWWWLCEADSFHERTGFDAIDDDFLGWRNVAPISPSSNAPAPEET